MFEFGSHLSHIYVSSGPSEPCSCRKSSDLLGTPAALDLSNQRGENISPVKDFHQQVRRLSGLKNDVFYNLRVPNHFQTSQEEINFIIITGAGVYCIDVKWWTGTVLAQDPQTWHIQMKREEHNLTNTSIQQVPDPLQDITRKARGLCSHMQRCGMNIKQSLFIPRVVFLSPHCNLDDELRKRKELIAYGDVETFLCSLRESYLTWITDAFTPSWISGHLSFRQLFAIRGVLSRMGTWDVIQLSSGQELKGDFQDCHHLAFNRQETDVLEFSRRWSLPTDTLWSMLGHTPQVNVKMCKRGAESWLGKPLTGTASIPSNTNIVFRISGEDKDSKIPANTIQTITLSI